MDIDFSRLVISLNECFDNYTIHTGRINGENISANNAVNGSCKDFNFIMISYKFTIHDTLLFAFLYFD